MAKKPAKAEQTDLLETIEKPVGFEQKVNVTAGSSTEEVVEPEIVADPPEIEEPDTSEALQKQIDALKKSEEIQRTRADQAVRENQEARQRAQVNAAEVIRVRKEASQSQFDAVSTALAAAQSEAESAKRDIKTAITNGDPDAQTDAYERLATARANISKLEDGKFELEAKLKAEPEKVPEVESSGDSLDRTNLPDTAKTWLRAHPDYLTDQRKNSKIQSLHWDVIDEGHSAFSPAYFESLETHLGLRKAPVVEEKVVVQQPQQRTSILSAPVSRETPSTPTTPRGGKITLTQDQREAAKIAGVTEAEYAKQLQKLNAMKANGTYGDRQ